MLFAWGRERIAREADMWVARLQGPDAEQHRSAAQAWRAADPRHEAAFHRSQSLWHVTASATRTPSSARPYNASATFGADRRLAFASIAAVLAAGGGAILLERMHAPVISQDTQIASSEQPRSVRLDDGSIVQLAANSALEAHFDKAIRAIDLLKGSARFSVAHDPRHPFIVSAGDRTVTARGTIFDVVLRPTGLSVTMIEGVVDVARRTDPDARRHAIRLTRGERLIVTGGAETISSAPRAASDAVTRDYPPTPLSRIVADANRLGSKPIRLGDAALGTSPVQGRFDVSDTAALARQLAAALDLALRDDGGAFTLVRLPTANK